MRQILFEQTPCLVYNAKQPCYNADALLQLVFQAMYPNCGHVDMGSGHGCLWQEDVVVAYVVAFTSLEYMHTVPALPVCC